VPALAELLGRADADRLAALKADLRARQAEAAAAPVRATCKSCGQHLPAPAVIFRDGSGR
jgi:hypothetical protein